MSRGYMYSIAKQPDDCLALYPDMMYESNYLSALADYFDPHLIEDRPFGILVEDNEEWIGIDISKQYLQDRFQPRLQQVKTEVAKLTNEDFLNRNIVDTISQLLDDTCGDMIYYQDCAYTIDSFFRAYCTNEHNIFYISKHALVLH